MNIIPNTYFHITQKDVYTHIYIIGDLTFYAEMNLVNGIKMAYIKYLWCRLSDIHYSIYFIYFFQLTFPILQQKGGYNSCFNIKKTYNYLIHSTESLGIFFSGWKDIKYLIWSGLLFCTLISYVYLNVYILVCEYVIMIMIRKVIYEKKNCVLIENTTRNNVCRLKESIWFCVLKIIIFSASLNLCTQ